MKNLIGMVDFVLETRKTGKGSVAIVLNSIYKYADFLKQPLELWMFVPCKLVDGVWVVLEQKKPFQDNYHEYQQAKGRCLFEGFAFYEHEDDFIYISFLFNKNKCQLIIDKESNTFLIDTSLFDEYAETIEDLVKYNLELTPAAQL